MKVGRAREARLHTAVSSGAEYSIISVQRFDDLMVPRFFWLDLSRIVLSLTKYIKDVVSYLLLA